MNRPNLLRLTRFGTQASLALAVAAALTVPLCAQAGSFQLPTDNAAGWARANAGGSLFANDPTAVYNNPAAMAFFTGPVLQVTGTGIRPSAQFNGTVTALDGSPVSGNNPNGFGKFTPFPDVAFAMPVNDRLTLGGSVTVPFGLISEYNPDWQGRYFGTKTSVQSVAVSFSAGFKVNDEFSIGAGILGQRTKAQLNTSLDVASAATALFSAAGVALPSQATDVQLNVNVKQNWKFGWFTGFEWKPTQQDSFGFSYHSRIENNLRGQYNIYGSAAGIQLLAMAPLLGPQLGINNIPNIIQGGTPANAQLNTPAFASLDWLHVFNDRFTLAATAKWTNWSSFQSLALYSEGQQLLALPEKYKNSTMYSIGGDYKLTDQWTLRGGIGYDETPTSVVSRDPRIPDGARKIVGLGVGYQASKQLDFDLGYQHQFVGKTTVNLTNQVLQGASTMTGYFDDHGDVVSLSGTYRF